MTTVAIVRDYRLHPIGATPLSGAALLLRQNGRSLLPYWILLAVWTAGTLQFSRRGTAAGAKPFYVFALIATGLMIGWRFHVGGDWRAYQEMFDTTYFLNIGNVLRLGDPGYTFLSWVVGKAGFGIVTVNLICAMIIVFGLGRFASRQPNPWLTIIVAVPYFIIVVSMGYTRQATAIGIIMAGLTGLRPAALSKLVFFVFVAATFHKSSVLILPILAVAVLRHNIFAGVASALVFIAFYFLFLNASADLLVANYVASNYDSQGAAIRVGMNTIAAIVLYRYRDRMGFDEFERIVWLTFAAFSMLCIPALVVASASSGIDRLALFFIPLQLVAIGRLPYAVSGKPQPNGTVFAAVIIYCCAVQFIWLNFAVNSSYWIPYRFALTDSGSPIDTGDDEEEQ